MRCPNCGHTHDRVLDTREQKDGQGIRRRRECLHCRARFSTMETMTMTYPFVIKKDGRREPFSREKLLKGLQAACQKRPVGLPQLETMVDRLSGWISGLGDREVSTRLIGEKVMRELRALDHVAYVRFASVYRTFHDIREFVDALEGRSAEASAAEPSQLSFNQVAGHDSSADGERIMNEAPSPGARAADLVST